MRPSQQLLAVAGGIALIAASASAQSPALTTWNALQAKRAATGAYHQEFEVDSAYVWVSDKQAHKRVDAIDGDGMQWRQTIGRGSSARILLYDGQSLFDLDGDEFIRVQRKTKDAPPVPSAYNFDSFELSKVVEVERRPCGFDKNDRTCVVFDAPVKAAMTQSLSAGVVQAKAGLARVIFDSETGVLVSRSTSQPVVLSRDSYRFDIVYRLKSVRYDRTSAEGLFAVPTHVHEVKKFTPWTAKRMNSMLGGKAAPDLNVTTLDGKTVSLESLKGKMVLLDFWATWCPPCRVDAPALDKLHAKYGSQLAIVGLSVGEPRDVVEKFLKKNPHAFPIVLTSENELARPYLVDSLPTYIIVDTEGHFEMAVQGDKGFDGLRDRLKKAGLDVD